MPAKCNPNSAMPARCVDAFGRINGQLGRMSGKLDAIHEQTTKTNGQVAKLFEQTCCHETQIQLLRSDVSDAKRGRTTWLRRIWQALIGLALLVAGYLLKS